MRSKLRGNLTYANVTATLALFLALGGAAVAAGHLARNSVGTKQLKPNAVIGAKVKDQSLTGADVNASTLEKVPSAHHADIADTAGTATSASHATQADNANTLGGQAPSEFAPAAIEGWHEVGAPGEPPFQNSWENVGGEPNQNQGVFSTAAFRRDPDGLVHLKGVVKGGTVSGIGTIFILPPGYRPQQGGIFAAASEGGEEAKAANVYIGATGSPFAGTVIAFKGGTTFFSLDGFTFLCGPSGQNGCP
jgi:hypothetical protein